MVLWEITLATAYFLGLKRTYRLALKVERRLVRRPKIRQFLYRRTRAIFDIALSVHRSIQQKDLEVGRNLGNRILRCLDRMKPSAQIRTHPPPKPTTNGGDTGKHLASSSDRQSPKNTGRLNFSRFNLKSDGGLHTLPLGAKSKSFPTLMTMMRPLTPTSTNSQYRQLSVCGPCMLKSSYATPSGFKGVFREDIVQWMRQN